MWRAPKPVIAAVQTCTSMSHTCTLKCSDGLVTTVCYVYTGLHKAPVQHLLVYPSQPLQARYYTVLLETLSATQQTTPQISWLNNISFDHKSGICTGLGGEALLCSIWHQPEQLEDSGSEKSEGSHSPRKLAVVWGLGWNTQQAPTHAPSQWTELSHRPGAKFQWKREIGRQSVRVICLLWPSLGSHPVSLLTHFIHWGRHRDLPRLKGRGHRLHLLMRIIRFLEENVGLEILWWPFWETQSPNLQRTLRGGAMWWHVHNIHEWQSQNWNPGLLLQIPSFLYRNMCLPTPFIQASKRPSPLST